MPRRQKQIDTIDLNLFTTAPDDPNDSILFDGIEILVRKNAPRGYLLWQLQRDRSNKKHRLLTARKFAQVVSMLNREDSADTILKILHDPVSYAEWRELEHNGSVKRTRDHTTVMLPPWRFSDSNPV